MRRALLIAILLALPGCPETRHAPAADAPCERLGERCRTPEGPLGVCNVLGGEPQGGECADPPCLTCVPQH